MKNSNVVILIVDMITGGKLHEVRVADSQDKFGKHYAKRLTTNLEHHWCWKSAANYLPDVKAGGPYTAIKFA
jgi:hypothetical protein